MAGLLHRALAPLAFTGLLACDTPSGTESLMLADDLAHLLVSARAGDIHVETSPAVGRIHVDAILYGRGTEVRAAVEGETLVLRPACDGVQIRCGIDWHITVPARETPRHLDLDADSGDIHVSDVMGTIDARTRSGSLSFANVASSSAILDAASGDVTIDASVIERLDVFTGSGDIEVSLLERPLAVELDTRSGRVDLGVPAGDYALELESRSGKLSLDRVTPNAAVPERIEISTGSGDVRVRGH